MNIWYAIPSARPSAEANQVLRLWHERGYKIALWRDDQADLPLSHVVKIGDYPGYAKAVNTLAKEIISVDHDVEWIVTGGDDVQPDLQFSAAEIGAQCSEHFKGTFGVMQPTGDRWGDARGAYIDRVCGSPWMGREFCQRMYGGRGPLFEGYQHMFVDQELQEVATINGCFQQRIGLIQLHVHWGRSTLATRNDIPPHLRKWNEPAHWAQSRELFETRKRGGFPGHEPL